MSRRSWTSFDVSVRINEFDKYLEFLWSCVEMNGFSFSDWFFFFFCYIYLWGLRILFSFWISDWRIWTLSLWRFSLVNLSSHVSLAQYTAFFTLIMATALLVLSFIEISQASHSTHVVGLKTTFSRLYGFLYWYLWSVLCRTSCNYFGYAKYWVIMMIFHGIPKQGKIIYLRTS